MHVRGPQGQVACFIISERDIEANSEKITAIRNLGLVANHKGTQKLIRVTIYLIAWGARDADV